MKPKQKHNWNAYLKLFLDQNVGRRTRLAVFEGTPESLTDYWLEDRLPLVGLDMDVHGPNGPQVQIMLQRTLDGRPEHMTHVVDGARFMKFTLSATGDSDGLEISNGRGETTILRFED